MTANPGDVLSLDLRILKDNPFQPRGEMDAAKLAELAASIASSGLLQPIAVRPKGAGEYIIVAGHRRVAAFRSLLASATTDEDRRRFKLIRAHVVAAVSDAQLAVAAYVENAQRADLNPLEEAAALAKIRELGGHATASGVAAATGQPERRVRRLLRLFSAPTVVKLAVSNGLLVDITDDEGSKRVRRRVDLMAALEFARLHEHLTQTKPDTADARTTTAMARALANNWGFRRIEVWVDQVLHPDSPRAAGEEVTAELAATGARSVPPKDKGTDEPGTGARTRGADEQPRKEAAGERAFKEVCSSTSERFSVYLARLKSASAEQLATARASLEDVRLLIDARLQTLTSGDS